MEIEAKFLIRRTEGLAELLAYLDDKGFAIEKRGTRTHLDTYFDTPDRAILREGWTYRCRQCGSKSTLTLKSVGVQQGNVFVREELEQTLADAAPSQTAGLPPGPVRDTLDALIGDATVGKLFSVKTRRTMYGLHPAGDKEAAIELDVDETRIRAKKAHEDAAGRLNFTELEFELEAGDPSIVAELAGSLREMDSLMPAHLSKFERGLYTAGLTPSLPAGDTATVSAGDPVLPVLFQFLGKQRRIMLEYQPVAWEGLDPEGVHKMRVATRRSRALLRAFRDLLAADRENASEAELRWLAGELGRARDADICVGDIARFEHTLSTDAALAAAAYVEHLEQTRADAYAGLAETFESKRYEDLMTVFGRFVSRGPATATLERWGRLSIEECAARLVGETARKVIKRGDAISDASMAKKLHRLRIVAKRLRYLLEFFSLAQPGQWVKPIAALQKLHDLLGDHQDAVTSRALLADYAESIPSGSAPRGLLIAIGRLMQIEDERIAEARARFPAVWKRFRKSMG